MCASQSRLVVTGFSCLDEKVARDFQPNRVAYQLMLNQ